MSAAKRRSRVFKSLLCSAAGISLLLGANATLAKPKEEVTVALQYGIHYLPLLLIRHDHLIEKRAKALGVKDVHVRFVTLSGGAALNDALLSGSVDIAASGVPPMIRLWAATRKTQNPVRAIVGNSTMPNVLVTTDPKVKTIKDFGKADRIAVPAVKISLQAITLEMAAARAWGEKDYTRLDPLTVSMKHPDAMVALISGHGGIDSHFGQSPFTEEEIQRAHAHVVLSTFSVLGGPATADVLETSTRFKKEHPRLFKAVLEAQEQAIHSINRNKSAAARIYLEESKSKFPLALVEKILDESKKPYAAAPERMMDYARFMHKVGDIKVLPHSWKDMFFSPIYNMHGS